MQDHSRCHFTHASYVALTVSIAATSSGSATMSSSRATSVGLIDGETIATFADPEDVFDDPTAYPAIEKDISDFSEWMIINRPALPSRIERSMVDVIAITDAGLEVLEPSGDRTPIAKLLDGEDESKSDGWISVDDLRR